MSLFALTFDNLRDLYLNELRDLYSAETQLIDALPKMAEVASAPELRRLLLDHLEQTHGLAERLEQIFDDLGEKPSGETCEAMTGLIREGEGYVKAGGNAAVRDAGLIGAAQRVEHYEIAAYGNARALAQRLGELAAVDLLQESLDEESETDALLTDIAEGQVHLSAPTS